MIQRILNWSLGGFFRTLGRVLAYFAISIVIMFIGAKIGLFGIVVHASTNAPVSNRSYAVKWCTLADTDCSRSTANFNTNVYPPSTTPPALPKNKIEYVMYTINSSQGWETNKVYSVSFSTYFTYATMQGTASYYYTEIWTSPNQDASGAIIGTNNNNVTNFACNVSPSANGENLVLSCSFIPKKTIKSLTIFYKLKDLSQISLTPNQGQVLWWGNDFIYDSDTGAYINNQTDVLNQAINNTTNAINDLDNTLQDVDTDSDTADMANYLENLDTQSDGLVSSLFTTIITFFENVFTTSSDNDFCTTFRGKTLCLPSGNLVWNNSYSCDPHITLCDPNASVNAFKQIFTAFVGGYISYKMLRSIIETISSATDPEKDKVEVPTIK